MSFVRLAYLIAVKTSSDMDFTYSGTNLTYVRQTRAVHTPFQLSRQPSRAILLPNSSRRFLNRKQLADIAG